MKNQPGYLIPADIDATLERCVLLCIPNDPRHIAAFWGNLYQLSYWFVWEQNEEKSGTDAAQVWREIWHTSRLCWEASEMGCEFVIPGLNELLQELIDLIEGIGEQTEITINTLYIDIDIQRTTLYTTFISAPTTIHIYCPDTTFTEDAGDPPEYLPYRKDALCYTIDAFTKKVWDDVYQQWCAAIGIAAPSIVLFAAVFAPLAAAGVLIVVTIGALLAWGLSVSLMENEDAKQKVRCCMYDALEEADITDHTDFKASLEGCGFDSLSDEGILAALIWNGTQDATNYLLFLKMLGQAFEVVTRGGTGYLSACTCSEELIDWTFYGPSNQGWESIEGTDFDVWSGTTDTAEALLDYRASDGYALMGPGEYQGEDLRMGGYVELYELKDIENVYMAVVGALHIMGLPFVLRLHAADKSVLKTFSQSWVGGGDWTEDDFECDPVVEDVKYISYRADNSATHGIDRCTLTVV